MLELVFWKLGEIIVCMQEEGKNPWDKHLFKSKLR